MIVFGCEALKLSVSVARALLAFASEDETRATLCSVGIDEGDVCATDGHAAVRFEQVELEPGCAAPTHWNRRIFKRAKVAAALKAAGPSGPVILLWSELEDASFQFAQLSKAEPASYVRDDDLPIAWDASLLAKLQVAARACRREKVPGEDSAPQDPPAVLVSLGGHLDPCRYEIGGEHWGTAAHAAFVTIMPMNNRWGGRVGSSGDVQVIQRAEDTHATRQQAAEAKAAAKRKREADAQAALERYEGERTLALSQGMVEDERASVELARLSQDKLTAAWTGRPAQKQALANVLEGRAVSRAQRQAMVAEMAGRTLGMLGFVVAKVVGARESAEVAA